MSEPTATTAHAALQELLDVSPQIDAAVVVLLEDSSVLASAPSSAERDSDRLADATKRLLAAAERARLDLDREPVAQLEISTREGHVFVVTDGPHAITAITDADPTVGLVFYDLKTALRSLRPAATASTSPSSAIVTTSMTNDSPAQSSNAADTTPAAPRSSRWRRGKQS
jgi:predicted regulator of Ras-like GTPase activity (Roadblock/LC7/MglB family)